MTKKKSRGGGLDEAREMHEPPNGPSCPSMVSRRISCVCACDSACAWVCERDVGALVFGWGCDWVCAEACADAYWREKVCASTFVQVCAMRRDGCGQACWWIRNHSKVAAMECEVSARGELDVCGRERQAHPARAKRTLQRRRVPQSPAHQELHGAREKQGGYCVLGCMMHCVIPGVGESMLCCCVSHSTGSLEGRMAQRFS